MSSQTRHAVHDTLPVVFPHLFPGFGEDAPLDLPPLSAATEADIGKLLVSRGFDAWSEALSRVGNCAHPIRLHGHSETVSRATGEIVSSYSSSQEPLGVTHIRCGNRRASECPSCSRLYAADMFHLIRAGVSGGKTVPASVADNPLVFATLTAPSFGVVHGRRDSGTPMSPAYPRCTAVPTRSAGDVPRPARRRGSEAWAAVVRRLLRLRLACGVAVVDAGFVATVHHHLAPAGRPHRSASQPSGWVRWRRCSTPRSPSTSCAVWSTSIALVRLDGPRTSRRVRGRTCCDRRRHARRTSASSRYVGAADCPGRGRRGPAAECSPLAGRSTPVPCGPVAVPTTRTGPWHRSRSPAIWPSTRPSPPTKPEPAIPRTIDGSGPPHETWPNARTPQRRDTSASTTRTSCSANGSTCSDSAATSPPSPGATRSRSAPYDEPAGEPKP